MSCKKDDSSTGDSKITVNTITNNLTCYPNDSISYTFELKVDGDGVYNYKWLSPDTLVGKGPFTVLLKKDLDLNVEVTDNLGNSVKYTYTVKKDTIDALEYDYRNNRVGMYICNVKESWIVDPLSDQGQQQTNQYVDTIDISKHDNFQYFKLSGFNNQYSYSDYLYNCKESSITEIKYNLAYYTPYRGEFKGDSLFIHYTSSHGMSNYECIGKKIGN